MRTILFAGCILASTVLTDTIQAQQCRLSRFRSRCNVVTTHRKPVKVVEKAREQKTTVINNLVGIPVPVNYREPIADQGSTIYGYSDLAESYNQVDMSLLYNQAARLTDQAQQLAGQASSDFSALIESESQSRAEVAKIIAQGQAAREALNAAKPSASKKETLRQRFSFQVTQKQNGELKLERLDGNQSFELASPSAAADNVSDLLKSKCVSCHNSENTQGGLNLLGPVTEEQQKAILERVTTDNLDLRMPRNPDGTAGQKLSVEELGVLFRSMGQ